jgi:hypothetical protein
MTSLILEKSKLKNHFNNSIESKILVFLRRIRDDPNPCAAVDAIECLIGPNFIGFDVDRALLLPMHIFILRTLLRAMQPFVFRVLLLAMDAFLFRTLLQTMDAFTFRAL